MNILLLLSLLAFAPAQDLLDASTEVAKTKPLAAVGTALANDVQRGTFHGVVAVVEIDGERVVEEVHGCRRLGPNSPMKLDSIFRIYSMTKPITGVAAMMLVEEEKLSLDDAVTQYLPAFADLTVGVERKPVARPMTVRDLLRHTAGLTYGFFAQSEVDKMVMEANILDDDTTLEQMVERLAEIPLKTQPGSTFEYSLASDVLGRVVEVASEMPLDQFFEKRLFAPLKMVDTGFHVPTEKLDRAAELYQRKGSDLAVIQGNDIAPPNVKPKLFSGGGGLFSTADDYMRFCRMLLHGGELDGVRILKPETVALMTTNQLAGIGSNPMMLGGGTFGLSMAIVNQSNGAGPAPGSVWWGGMAGTHFWIDPKQDVIGVFMIQNMMELNHSFVFQANVYRELQDMELSRSN